MQTVFQKKGGAFHNFCQKASITSKVKLAERRPSRVKSHFELILTAVVLEKIQKRRRKVGQTFVGELLNEFY